MRATIDITGTKIDPASLPPELRAKLDTEKPIGSKELYGVGQDHREPN